MELVLNVDDVGFHYIDSRQLPTGLCVLYSLLPPGRSCQLPTGLCFLYSLLPPEMVCAQIFEFPGFVGHDSGIGIELRLLERCILTNIVTF